MTIELRRREHGDVSLLTGADISPLLKHLYIQRGINSTSELERSIHGLLTYHQLVGIDQAVDILVYALLEQRKLLVVGDFDVDGATSIALVVLALQQMEAQLVDFIVPNRFKDGYGLSIEIMDQAIARGTEVIITVDNGITSYAGVECARQNGILVIITDHHLPNDTLPVADAIVNPNLPNCNFASKSLAGVGVAFYLMLALRARLNEIGWFTSQGIGVPKLAELLDLVALGTVADVVPLDVNNRILVHQGISRIRAGRCCPGIRALAEVANCNPSRLCANDLGFILGPRLNAAGRLNDMSIGVALLLTKDLLQARIIAMELNALNKTRQEIEQRMESEALDLCQLQMDYNNNEMPFGLAIYHAKWHQGVVGIIASRVKDRFHRPVIAFAPAGNSMLKGSGRSIIGLHMYDLLQYLDNLYPGMMLKFGGHAMAVGLLLRQTQFDNFRRNFVRLVNELIDPSMLDTIIWSDGELTGQELSLTTAELLRDAGPWGQEFPDPLFDGEFRIINQCLVGSKHLKLRIEPLVAGPILDGIIFNVDTSLWPNNDIHTVKLVYKLGIRESHGICSLQLLIQYIWPIR